MVSGAAIDAAGWRQGSLLPAELALEHALWCHHETQGLARPGARQIEAMRREGNPPTEPQLFPRPAKQGERLVVTSHTCDVIKSSDVFPAVEVVLAVVTGKQRVLDDARNLGSAQYFLLTELSESEGLVLDFRWRTQIDKGFLAEHKPDNGVVDSWDAGRDDRFRRWLGRRYSRPVLSDQDVEEVLDPIRDAWKTLSDREPGLAAEVSRTFIEFRFRRTDAGLEIFVLSPEETPDEALTLELFGVLEEALRPFHAEIMTRTDRVSYSTFTRSDDLSTEAIDLEWASGDETQPAPRTKPRTQA